MKGFGRKWFSLMAVLAVFLGLAWLFSSRNTTRRQEQLQLRRLKLELRHLHGAAAFLEAYPNPRKMADAHVFLSDHLIRNLLKGLETEVFRFPGEREIELRLDQTEITFANGSPLLDLKLKIKAGDWNGGKDIAVMMLAWLEFEINPKEPEFALMHVRIAELVPLFSWRGYQFSAGAVINQILSLDRDDLLDLSPSFRIPLSRRLSLEIPAESDRKQWSVGTGAVAGELAFKGFSYHRHWSIDQLLFTKRGVHLFFRVARQEGGPR